MRACLGGRYSNNLYACSLPRLELTDRVHIDSPCGKVWH